MKNKLMTFGLVGAATLAWAAKDPVLMTVNGVDVPKSEFEYLYHKNSQQQLEAQPLEDYVEMFKIYKLKVADALANGIDTTASFRKEMDQYKRELAAPYLADSLYLNKLVDDSYNRAANEAEAIHIMLFKPNGAPDATIRNRADSLRQAILNGQDFTTIAANYSQDRASSQNGGNMGYITVNRLPYHFEEAAFNLSEGEISDVVESPVGYHILKGGKKRPARGTVLAAHILKMVPQTATDAEKAAAKQWIDSVYNELKVNPNSFESIALNYSDDKGSARQGGLLPWFGAGQMVAPFDSAAFAMNVGEISQPVESQFGWHIIKKLDAKQRPSREEMKAELLPRFSNPQDERMLMIRQNTVARLAKKHKGKVNSNVFDAIRKDALANGIDSLFYDRYAKPEEAARNIYSIGKKNYTVNDFFSGMRKNNIADGSRAAEFLNQFFDYFQYKKLIEAEEEWLLANEPEYRNLVKEYRDGSLLYEVSVNKVWDRASKDNEGLEKYFKAHRENYKWNRPHVKGILVQTVNDSVAGVIKNRLMELGADTLLTTARKEFGKQASIEKVLVEQGSNPMVDNLVFGGPKVSPSNSKYATYFLFDAVKLDEPEEVNDVRGMVTSDYQNQLELDWVEELKAKYPVVVNEKVLRKVK